MASQTNWDAESRWRSTSAINLRSSANEKRIDSLVAWLIPTIRLPDLLTYLQFVLTTTVN